MNTILIILLVLGIFSWVIGFKIILSEPAFPLGIHAALHHNLGGWMRKVVSVTSSTTLHFIFLFLCGLLISI